MRLFRDPHVILNPSLPIILSPSLRVILREHFGFAQCKLREGSRLFASIQDDKISNLSSGNLTTVHYGYNFAHRPVGKLNL